MLCGTIVCANVCVCVRVCMHLPVPPDMRGGSTTRGCSRLMHRMAQSAACCEAWETEGLSEAAVPLALKDDGAALYLHDIAPAERAGVLLRSSDYMRRFLRTRTFSRVFVDA